MITLSHLEIPGQVRSLMTRYEDWLGVWAIEEDAAMLMQAHLATMNLVQHIEIHQAAKQQDVKDQASYLVTDGVAVIPILGTMQKSASSLGGASTVAIRRAVANAANDPEVGAILLKVESPGGTVSGTDELANTVSLAAAKKPLFAFIEDIGASAAYWVASQAQQIYVNRTGRVGSIGTYMAVADYSGAAAQRGVKVHVVRAGKFKGAGEPGTEITAEQLANWQATVDRLNGFFVEGVASGRKMSREKVIELADGRVHVGQAAVELGLADGVRTYEQVLGELKSNLNHKKGAKMSVDPSKPVSATIAELRTACPGADEKFILSQIEKNATVTEAMAAFLKLQQDQLQAAEKRILEAEAKANKPGNQPAGSGIGATKSADQPMPGDLGSLRAQWDSLVSEKMKTGYSRAMAVQAVAREKPELHEQFVAAANR